MVDLHLHSTFSDGSDSPEEIARLGAEAGLRAMALTDHDSLRGTARFMKAASALGVKAISGAEISVKQSTGHTNELHILAYGLDPECGEINAMLEKMRSARHARNVKILRKLTELGHRIPYEDVASRAGDGEVVGRPHIAEALVGIGAASSVRDAFTKFLAHGGRAYVEREKMLECDAIAAIARNGGVPILAHPKQTGVSLNNMPEFLSRLKSYGLAGAETYYTDQNAAFTGPFKKIMDELGLLSTGGSDYHGRFKPDIHVGTGLGWLSVPDESFEALEQMAANAKAQGGVHPPADPTPQAP